MTPKEELKIILRETACPFFTDEQLDYYLSKNVDDVNKTAYDCLIIKAEDTTVAISGLSVADTSKYFLRLAQKYRPNNGGILGA